MARFYRDLVGSRPSQSANRSPRNWHEDHNSDFSGYSSLPFPTRLLNKVMSISSLTARIGYTGHDSMIPLTVKPG